MVHRRAAARTGLLALIAVLASCTEDSFVIVQNRGPRETRIEIETSDRADRRFFIPKSESHIDVKAHGTPDGHFGYLVPEMGQTICLVLDGRATLEASCD